MSGMGISTPLAVAAALLAEAAGALPAGAAGLACAPRLIEVKLATAAASIRPHHLRVSMLLKLPPLKEPELPPARSMTGKYCGFVSIQACLRPAHCFCLLSRTAATACTLGRNYLWDSALIIAG